MTETLEFTQVDIDKETTLELVIKFKTPIAINYKNEMLSEFSLVMEKHFINFSPSQGDNIHRFCNSKRDEWLAKTSVIGFGMRVLSRGNNYVLIGTW